MVQAFDIEPKTCLKVSAKTGLGLESVLPAVIEQVPAPVGDPAGPLRMLLFDAFHDEYRCALLSLSYAGISLYYQSHMSLTSTLACCVCIHTTC